MTDVARLAGVSAQTVSRVLNNPDAVKPRTRKRVDDAIARTGYQRNPAARSLVTGRSHTLGIVTMDTLLVGPSATMHGIVSAAEAAGFFVSVAGVRSLDPATVEAAVRRLVSQSVEGLVVQVPRRALAAVLHELPRQLPSVVIDGPADLSFSTVTTDSVAGGCLAVEHLLSLGHETVHFVRGAADFHATQMREDGWRQTLKRHKRRTPRPFTGDWTSDSGYAAGQRLAADPGVTAVFAANDQMALGVLHAFHDAGIPVPERVSIVGFDGIPEAAHFIPPLTTIKQDFAAFGGVSIAALLSQLDPLAAAAPSHHLIAPSLIVRQSTTRVSP